MLNLTRLLIVAVIVALAVAGLAPRGAAAQASPDLRKQAVQTYADIVYANYQDSVELARALDKAIVAFIAQPSEATMDAARAAWLAAREPYGQTEAFRFYGGPIDGEDGPEGQINAWPLDEAYIDYVEGDPIAGVINNPEKYPVINPELLAALNEQGGEKNISAGFHAIEFLLWGQDMSADSAGKRPHTDFVKDSAPNAERRATYLRAASELLVDDLTRIANAWKPDQRGNYRQTFLALPPDDALQKILTGIGVLSRSELAGERIFTPYDNQDQEDEHSCFSDNTHRDIYKNALGIANVYLGRYKRLDDTTISGTGIHALLKATDAALADKTLALVEKMMANAEKITQMAPFDQAIINPETRPHILQTVDDLQTLGDTIAESARALGIKISTDLP